MHHESTLKARIQKTVVSRQNKRRNKKTNHESTKTGKHEKGRWCLSKALFFRGLLPSYFRGDFLFFKQGSAEKGNKLCNPLP